jgi:hypothetical protein
MYHRQRNKLCDHCMMELLSILPRRKAVFGLSLPISVSSTKRNGFVSSAIARSHICRLLPVVPSEGHSLLEKSRQAGRALTFDSSGCDNNTTHDWNFSAYLESLVSYSPVIQSVWRRAFSATFANILNIKTLLCWNIINNCAPKIHH